MAVKETMQEEFIVEDNLHNTIKKVSNALSTSMFTKINTNNDLYQITANYKEGSVRGEVLITFFSEEDNKTKVVIESTAAESIFSLANPNEVIIEEFKSIIELINNNINDTITTSKEGFQSIANNSDNSNSTFILTITRINQFYAINPPVKIIVDNIKEYKVENGESIEIPVSYGVHNIKFSCNIRDKIIDINIKQNSVLNINFNRLTGSIEVSSEQSIFAPAEIQQLPYNTLCVVGIVISGVSLLLNFFGIVGIVGTALSVAGLLDCQKKNENGKALAIIGIVIGIISILYAFYILMYSTSHNEIIYYWSIFSTT